MIIYATVQGGRFPRKTSVAITIQGGSIAEQMNQIIQWKRSVPGLTYFSLEARSQ